MQQISQQTSEMMTGRADEADASFGEAVADLQCHLEEAASQAQSSADELVTVADTSASQLVQDTAAQTETAISEAEAAQAEIVAGGLAEVRAAGETALGEMRTKNEGFATDLSAATDESVAKAIESASQVAAKAQEAANAAGAEHERSLLGQILSGIWSAIKSIAVGLVILVVVALVVAAIAALFSVTLNLLGLSKHCGRASRSKDEQALTNAWTSTVELPPKEWRGLISTPMELIMSRQQTRSLRLVPTPPPP